MTLHPPLLPAPELAAQLKAGGAAIFPTDTLPALAAAPNHASQLWELKDRPQHKPVILMGADAEALFALLGTAVQPAWRDLAQAHWPGALTLVLPARGAMAQLLNPGGSSLGLRVPACAQALELLRLSGPLATTSANRSGEPPCLSAEEAAERFADLPLLAPATWPQPSGTASTVLRWCEPGRWQLLRRGAVMPAGLQP